MTRVHAWGTVAWAGLACAAGLGFVARDLLALPGAAVAVAWLLGAVAGAATAHRGCREQLRP